MRTFDAVLLALSGFCLLPDAMAQFNFFEQMFGHGQQQQQRGSGVSQWASQADAGNNSLSPLWMCTSFSVNLQLPLVPCGEYLCPATLVCVSSPADCPCPSVEDEKCIIPDKTDKNTGTVLCVRGTEECSEVLRLSSRWS